MNKPNDLTVAQLMDLAARIQELLYVDLAPNEIPDEDLTEAGVLPNTNFLNPDKEWEASDVLCEIADILGDYGLVPAKVEKYEPWRK